VGGSFALLLILFTGQAFAQTEATEKVLPGNPLDGRRLFVEHGCYRCHAVWGNGGTLGPDFATAGAGHSLAELAGTFWNHTPSVIEANHERGLEWPVFTETELANVISYIYYVKLFDEPGDPELGEQWFVGKQCVRCHSVGDDSPGPDRVPLNEFDRYLSPVMLAEEMWNHGSRMRTRQAEMEIPTPSITGREIADLQAFIRQSSTAREREIELLAPPDPNAGRRSFTSKGCVRCHGSDGRGSRFAPDLQEVLQTLTVSEIAGELWNHSAKMTSTMRQRGIQIPRFDGSEMADVIAFLYYLRFFETSGDASRGEQIFDSKGCSSCHAHAGRYPSSAGPDLGQSTSIGTLLGLATAMWNHAPAMQNLSGEDVEWPRFQGDEMSDLAAYLRSIAATPPKP